MAGQKPTLVSHKHALLWFIGLTVLYQVIYQFFMYRAIQQEALDDECSAPLLGSGPAGQSQQCIEVQLFRSWQEADSHLIAPVDEPLPDHLVKDSAPVTHFGEMTEAPRLPLQALPDNTSGSNSSNASANSTEVLPISRMHGAINAIAEATAAATAAAASRMSTTTAARGVPGAAGPAEAEGASPGQGKTAPANGTQEKPWSPVTAWAAGLEDLQQHLEAHMDHLPSMIHKHAHEQQEQMDNLVNTIATSLNSSSKDTALTPWAKELVNLQEHLNATLQHRAAAHHAHLTIAPSSTTEVPLLERIYRVGHEMCSTPDHRDRPECAQFLGSAATERMDSDAQRLARRSAKVAWRANISEETEIRAARLEARLAEIHADREVWEEALVTRLTRDGLARGRTADDTGAAVIDPEPARPQTALRRGKLYIHWSSVKAWHGPRWWEKSLGPETLTREEVQGAHWAGMIPKVACITAISSGHHATAQMKYFINNFHLQDYEGPRQLIIVYHDKDQQAAKLVQKYADGVSIRGVAARSNESFPSTTGLRYGAWLTDADAIARWDFDEWHHPQRLSLQVRALALSSRPACLLHQSDEGGLEREASIVGEAVWMRRHWRPLAEDERAALAGSQAPRVVELHAEALRHPGHGGGSPASATSRAPTPVPSRAASRVCLKVLGAGAPAEVPNEELEESIGKEVGVRMQELYRGLATRRQDAMKKLRSLCVESAAESDPERRTRLEADTERMSAILGELEKHFAALDSLFGRSH